MTTPATFISFNQSLALPAKIVSNLRNAQQACNGLLAALAIMKSQIADDPTSPTFGTDVTTFTMVQSQCGYPDNATAMASWADLNVLATTAQATIAKIMDSCAKHGV